jgi:carbon-monoxide dehydrogenase medium subunit
MQSFAYAAPATLTEALDILKSNKRRKLRTQMLAGGTDLLVQMRGVDRAPRTILDVKNLKETNRLKTGGKETFVGAAIPGVVLTANRELAALYPGLVEAIDLIGSSQIQGRASLGGNLCNASPAGDTIPAIIANSGICVIASGRGTRELAAEKFVIGVGKNALKPGEILLGIRFPKPAKRTSDAYLRFIPRTEMDIAVAGAGVSISLNKAGKCTAARVCIGAVAPTALLVPAAAKALIGTHLEPEALAAAGAAASAAAKPITDKRGTVEYRRQVVAVLVRRAARIAADRAKES